MSKAPNDNQPTPSALGDAYERVTERMNAAYSTAIDKAGSGVQGAASALESNPLVAVLGGIAVGAIAGALIPRLAQEKDLLAPIGGKIGDAARAALDAGKTAGTEALTGAGLSTDSLRGQVSALVDQAIKAAGAAGTAAVGAARDAARN